MESNTKICIGNEKKYKIFAFAVFALLVLVTRLWYINKIYGPFVFNDEMGYWSHAASIAGKHWTNTEKEWYSYGYSLILAPLFHISNDMTVIYRVAIGINAVFGILQFGLGIGLIRAIDIRVKWQMEYLISFVATCFSSYLFQSYIGWAETFLYMWTMFTVYGVFCLIKNTSIKNIVLVSLQLVFMYMIHNRSIVVMIAYGIILIIMCIAKKIDIRKVILSAIIIGCGFLLDSVIKDCLQDIMWSTGNIQFSGNDRDSVFHKLSMALSSVRGVVKLGISFIEKIWSIMAETLLLGYFGFVFIIKNIVKYAKNKNKISFYYLFCSLVVIGTIALTAIAINPDVAEFKQIVRLDIFFYCRYSDAVCGMLIIFGLLEICSLVKQSKEAVSKHKFEKECLLGIFIFILCSLISASQVSKIDLYYLNTLCVPGLYLVRDFKVWKVVCCVVIIGIIMMIICKLIRKHVLEVVSVGVCIIFCYVAINAFFVCIEPNQKEKIKYQSIVNCIENLETKYPVYIYSDGDNRTDGYYQIRQRVRVQLVDANASFEPFEADNMLIVAPNEVLDEILELYPDGRFVYCESPINLMVRGTQVINDIEKLGYKCSNEIERLDVGNYILESQIIDYENDDNEIDVDVTISNPDGMYLYNSNELLLSYHIYDEDGNCVLYDGQRTSIGNIVGTQTYNLVIDKGCFHQPGTYTIVFDLVQEGVTWNEQIGGHVITSKVKIY